jgi:hypothetical protein
MSSDNGCLLKGSVDELSKCRIITGRSITLPEGSVTGSSINVSINGSVTNNEQLHNWKNTQGERRQRNKYIQ